MTTLSTRRIRLTAGLLGFFAILPGAHAAITATTGNVTAGPAPASVLVGALESDTVIPAFGERRRQVLTVPLNLDITAVGIYDVTNPGLTPGVVPPGTTISSYFLHGDALGAGQANLNGSITFDERIIGIQITDAGLKHLYGLKSLKTLRVYGSYSASKQWRVQVTKAGIEAIQEALPNCKIISDFK